MAVYISELKVSPGQSEKFVEIVTTDGEDISGYTIAVYDPGGLLASTLSFGTVDVTYAGNNGYVVTQEEGFPLAASADWSFAIIDEFGNVVQFIGVGSPPTAVDGPAVGESPTAYASPGNTKSIETNDGGLTYSASSPNPGTIPCYAPGTMIDTPDGPRSVETLQPGDLVVTLDHGPQAIRWIRSSDHPLEDAEDEAKPVLINAGALGLNLPTHDLIVSPQHRILVGGARQLQPVFTREAFAPAKSLTALPGIRHMRGKSQITWIHFACDRHEVVTANGCFSESLLLGPMVVNGLQAAARRALTGIFGIAPTPDAALNGPSARECLTIGAVKRRLAKHRKEKGQLVTKKVKEWDRELAMEKYEAGRLIRGASLAQPHERALHAV